VLALAGACAPEPLEPGHTSPTVHPTPPRVPPVVPVTPIDLTAAVAALAGPNSLMIVARNGGAVVKGPTEDVHTFAQDPGKLVDAAAAAGMHVCSVEMDALALSSSPDEASISISEAVVRCATDRRGDMAAQLDGLRTPATVVIIAANAAVTVRTTNGGINFFYDEDILRLLWSAREVYVPACIIVPSSLSLPVSAEGQTPGVSVDAALAACGR
jgi:hypothetical protein